MHSATDHRLCLHGGQACPHRLQLLSASTHTAFQTHIASPPNYSDWHKRFLHFSMASPRSTRTHNLHQSAFITLLLGHVIRWTADLTRTHKHGFMVTAAWASYLIGQLRALRMPQPHAAVRAACQHRAAFHGQQRTHTWQLSSWSLHILDSYSRSGGK